MKGLTIRIIRQMKNDRRSLALLIIAPVLIMSLLYLLLGESSYVPKAAFGEGFPASIISALEKQDIEIKTLSGEGFEEALENGDIDAYLTISPAGINILMLESSAVKTEKLAAALSKASGTSGIVTKSLYGKDHTSAFDSMGYILLGVMSFFIVFILSGISFIRERTTGTLERLMLTPIRRCSVTAGYTIGFGLFAALQSIIIVLYSQYVLGMKIEGSVFLVFLIMILLAFTAVSTGNLVSIFANNEFQVVQFIPVIIIPQIFFSGLIPVDTFPYHLGLLSYIMPVYYGATALDYVIIRGWGFREILPYLGMLLFIVALLFSLSTFALKKYRKF